MQFSQPSNMVEIPAPVSFQEQKGATFYSTAAPSYGQPAKGPSAAALANQRFAAQAAGYATAYTPAQAQNEFTQAQWEFPQGTEGAYERRFGKDIPPTARAAAPGTPEAKARRNARPGYKASRSGKTYFPAGLSVDEGEIAKRQGLILKGDYKTGRGVPKLRGVSISKLQSLLRGWPDAKKSWVYKVPGNWAARLSLILPGNLPLQYAQSANIDGVLTQLSNEQKNLATFVRSTDPQSRGVWKAWLTNEIKSNPLSEVSRLTSAIINNANSTALDYAAKAGPLKEEAKVYLEQIIARVQGAPNIKRMDFELRGDHLNEHGIKNLMDMANNIQIIPGLQSAEVMDALVKKGFSNGRGVTATAHLFVAVLLELLRRRVMFGAKVADTLNGLAVSCQTNIISPEQLQAAYADLQAYAQKGVHDDRELEITQQKNLAGSGNDFRLRLPQATQAIKKQQGNQGEYSQYFGAPNFSLAQPAQAQFAVPR